MHTTHNDTHCAVCSKREASMEVATDVKDFVSAHRGLFEVLENGKVGDVLPPLLSFSLKIV